MRRWHGEREECADRRVPLRRCRRECELCCDATAVCVVWFHLPLALAASLLSEHGRGGGLAVDGGGEVEVQPDARAVCRRGGGALAGEMG